MKKSSAILRKFALRSLYHICILIVPIYIILNPFQNSYVTKSFAIFGVTIILLLYIAIDISRLYNYKVNSIFQQLFSSIMKNSEKKSFNGSVPMFLGVLLLLIFFRNEIVIISIVFTAVGDPSAKLIGFQYGRSNSMLAYFTRLAHFPNKKSIVGSIAFFSSCLLGYFILCLFMMHYNPSLSSNSIFYISLPNFLAVMFGAFVATFIELFADGKNIFRDDNFLIPTFTAIGVCTMLYYLKHVSFVEIFDFYKAFYMLQGFFF